MTASSAPVPSRSNCHGTMLEWCSRVEITIRSPGPIFARPQAEATRLRASVAPRVQTTSSASRALMKRATVSLAASNWSVQA